MNTARAMHGSETAMAACNQCRWTGTMYYFDAMGRQHAITSAQGDADEHNWESHGGWGPIR